MFTLSPPNFVHTSRSVHKKLIPALRMVLKSRKCSRRFDHKGDWAVEPSEVIIFVSENVAERSRAGWETQFWRNLLRHPAREAHCLSWTSRLGSNKAVSALVKQESVGRENSTLLAVVCQAWRHFLSRWGRLPALIEMEETKIKALKPQKGVN